MSFFYSHLIQEVKPNLIERLEDLSLPMEKLLEELMDGDIIVFQRDEDDLHQYSTPTPKEYFRSVYLLIFG